MSRFDEESEDLLADLKEAPESYPEVEDLRLSSPASCEAAGVSFGRQGNWFSFSIESESRGDETIEEEVTRCFEQLNGKAFSHMQIQQCPPD